MSEKKFHWHGRIDEEDGDQGLRWHQKIQLSNEQSDIALCGFACDLGVLANKGRGGAKAGPNAIRSALSNLAWHADEMPFDAGDVTADDDLAAAQQRYSNKIARLLNQHSFVIGMGGGHEIAWPSYLGLYESLPAKTERQIGIINFDAHFDLRKCSPTASSGTPFRQIAEHCEQNRLRFHYACLGVSESANTPALFAYANKTGTRYVLDSACTIQQAIACLTPMLEVIDELYVTICLDAFPAFLAPGVSAPSAYGIQLPFVIDTLKWLAAQQQTLQYTWRLTDIAEMNPTYDVQNITARLAARCIFEIVKARFPQNRPD